MSTKLISSKSKSAPKPKIPGPGGMDWAVVDAMTDEEVIARALTDPDNLPSTPEQLARGRRISYAKHVRWNLGLSQEQFAERFGIPIGTLRDWEQHRSKPDAAAESYLKVIAKNPKAVMKALG
jgi:putative transcriptional regulator